MSRDTRRAIRVHPERTLPREADAVLAIRRTFRAAPLVLAAVGCLIATSCSRPLYRKYQIPSASMEPTIARDEWVTVRQIEPGKTPGLHRGDIVVFLQPHSESKKYMKRVVGLPGDVIGLRAGTLMVNGSVLDEPYVARSTIAGEFPATRVPRASVFVLGDNRGDSFDSRHFGFVPIATIIGLVDR